MIHDFLPHNSIHCPELKQIHKFEKREPNTADRTHPMEPHMSAYQHGIAKAIEAIAKIFSLLICVQNEILSSEG